MATPEEIEQAAVGATLKMEELGYEVFELPRHDERGIAVLLASKGKEQRLVCAVNKNNHKNDWTIPKAFEWFTSSLRTDSNMFSLMSKFDMHYDLVITWFVECEEHVYVSMRICDVFEQEE